MLNISDIIQDAHCRQGHMKVEKTLANCSSMLYSPTYHLCQLFIPDCFVCHEKHPNVLETKGSKKPILSSEFLDHIQVDLIDMKAMRKWNIYGNMQRWIMTVGEIFWLHWLSQNLSHWCVYHYLYVKPISFCFFLLIISYFSLYSCSIQTMGRSKLQQLLLTY